MVIAIKEHIHKGTLPEMDTQRQMLKRIEPEGVGCSTSRCRSLFLLIRSSSDMPKIISRQKHLASSKGGGPPSPPPPLKNSNPCFGVSYRDQIILQCLHTDISCAMEIVSVWSLWTLQYRTKGACEVICFFRLLFSANLGLDDFCLVGSRIP